MKDSSQIRRPLRSQDSLSCRSVSSPIFRHLLPALAILAGPILSSALADSGTWINTVTGGVWSDPLNWNADTIADGSGFTADFGALDLTADNTVQLDSARVIGGLSFGDTDPLSAAGWTIDNGGIGSNTLTLAGGTPTITVGSLAAGKVATISAVLDGTAGLTKAGNGTLALTGANIYTGTTTITGGILSVDTIADVGASNLSTGGVTLNGGTLQYTAVGTAATTTRTFSAANTTTGNAIEITDAGSTLTINSAFAGNIAGSVTKQGSGTLTLTGTTDNSSLVLNVADGTVNLGKNGVATVRAVAGISNIAAGATVKLTGTGTDQIYGGSATGAAGLVNMSGGTLDLNAHSESLGRLTGTGTVTSSAAGAITLTLGETNGTGSFGGVIQNGSGTVALTKIGTGTVTLTGANTYTGATTISAGTLALSGDDDRLKTTGTVVFPGVTGSLAGTLMLSSINQTLSSITLPNLTPTGASTLSYTVNGGGALTINGATDLQFGPGGALANHVINTTVNVSGLSSFTVNAPSNTFRVGFKSGTTNTVSTASSTTVTLSPFNTVTGSLLAVGDIGSSAGGGTTTLRLGAANIFNVGNINMGLNRANATLDFSAGSSAAVFRGTNGVSPVGTWTLGTAASGDGLAWTVNANFANGTIDALMTNLTIGNATTSGQLNRRGTVNGTFSMGAGTLTATTINLGLYGAGAGTIGAGTYNGNGTFTLNSATGTVNATTINFATNIGTATGGTARTATGTFNLTNGRLNATTLQFGAQTGNATSVTANFNWAGGTIGNLTGGDLSISGANVVLSGSAANHDFDISAGQAGTVSSVISGTGLVRKSGLGTLTLSGANTFIGATTLNAGTLLVSGSLTGSDVTVNAGTLGGAGNIIGTMLIGDGLGSADAILSPGTSIGTLTTGSIDFFSDAVFKLEIDSGLLVSDRLTTSGGIDLGVGVAQLNALDLGNATLLGGELFTFIHADGGIAGQFAGLDEGDSLLIGTNTFTISYAANGGTDVTLLAVIPEPSSAVMLLGGIGLILARRRRR